MSDVTIDYMIEVMQALRDGKEILWKQKEYTQEEAKALDEEVQRLRAIQNGDWIKNTKTCLGVPDELPPNTRIVAVFDDGSIRNAAPASNWKHCWDSSVSPHIAKYRIVK